MLAPGGAADVRGNFVTDVTKIKRTEGKNIVAAVGWRAGDSNNGLWYSTDYGQTFTNVTAAADAAGFAPQANIGRIALATTRADPNLIYASVQDAVCLSSPAGFCPPGTVWNGLYKSTSGPTGPWVKVADSSKFASDPNSAQNPAHIGPLYQPGIGAWYNEYVIIDPTNPDHVITGLEEIYQTTDGGVTWQTIGRYWDFCIDSSTSWCNSDPPAPTTHPDQHAAAFAVTSAGTPKLYVGSDGGAWSQTGATDDNDHWTNLNDTLSITQPYYAAASAGANPTIYAGTQDNGSQKFDGTKWVEVFGGDGGDVTVEPQNPDRTIEEYVYLAMSASTDGGHVWHDASTPDSGSSSTARFISPFDLDPLDPHRVVALGKSAWVRTKGANTTPSDWTSTCDGTNACDQGSGHVGTALGVRGSAIYTGWCGPCNPTPNPIDPTGTGFQRGMFSTVGGTWHPLAAAGLPNRYITSVTIDPSNTSHIFVTLSGFSRRWVPYAGTGNVFESTDGGASFTDISGNLPDDPANDTVLFQGRLIAATDVGVFERTTATTWARLGAGMPNVSTLDLSLIPGTHTLLAATHGEGLYKIGL
ncbi:MAG TPA: hypothetical protein DIU14_03890 [Actinobacteria bacterium]|nr:hypothetical protein [Actinomycetota bacterium]